MSHFDYLIDQQCSQRMLVTTDESSYQSIVLSTETRMFSDHRSELIRLSREQALALIPLLQAAADEVPIPAEHVEYPGKVLP